MCPHVLKPLSEIDVVIERILGTAFVQDVSGIAKGTVNKLSGCQISLDCYLHTLDPVEAIEDTENVDTSFSRLMDKRLDDIIWVVYIANRIGRSQQHL